MLKTVRQSANRKTGPIAVTYRAGAGDVFNTCPATCPLNPRPDKGASTLDVDYLEAVRHAVPRNGTAWTYSHFPAEALPMPCEGKTVFNASCDSMADAVRTVELGRPAVYAAPVGTQWPQRMHGVLFAQCPAELADNFTCQQCGNGSPLCARGDRSLVVVFVAHGSGKKRVGTGKGGCYAAGGPTAIQWHGLKKTGRADDAVAVRSFARSLPSGSLLRHHVAGDIGSDVCSPS